MSFFKITDQLYISDRVSASCEWCLHRHQITHVLTVDSEALATKCCAQHSCIKDDTPPQFDVKFTYAQDQLNFNILGVLKNCLEYIRDSVKSHSTNKVLVHWWELIVIVFDFFLLNDAVLVSMLLTKTATEENIILY